MGSRTSLFSGVLHLGKAIFINYAKKFFYEPGGLFYPVFFIAMALSFRSSEAKNRNLMTSIHFEFRIPPEADGQARNDSFISPTVISIIFIILVKINSFPKAKFLRNFNTILNVFSIQHQGS